MSLKKPIQIFSRLKPMPKQTEPFPYEIEQIDVDGTDDEILVFNMKDGNSSSAPSEGYYAHRTQDNHRFRYSKVFDRDTTQETIFEEICKPVVDGALTGYNGTIFAYGQTGSGKTYTMTGSRDSFDQRGIIPRTLTYIFQKFQELEDGMELQAVYISYLEIYNENGYDLLHPNMEHGLDGLKKVVLMEDAQQQIHLKHLSVNPVSDEDQAMHLFYMGEHHRTIAETPMNEASTRSHCVFTIHIHSRESQGSLVRKSKIHLVDLAGSERIANSNISGQLFNEARHINLALHYLEHVIVALGEANRTHIPYRNSMMTSILRDSLGGNCMTTMIATISLEYRNIPESLSTCRFSQRVALVTNDATLNEEMDPDLLIAQLKAEIKRLKSAMSTTSFKMIADNSAPITEQEFDECCQAVQTFLMDSEDDAVLAITPDMRLIQKCFQCLKCACNEAHEKVNNSLEAYKYNNEAQSENLSGDQKMEQLWKTLAYRENEIKVLTKMLKESQEKNKVFENPAIPEVLPEVKIQLNKKPSLEKEDPTLVKLDAVTQKLAKPPYSPPRDPETSRPSIDKESLLLEGFNENKKAALENFLKNYPDKPELDSTREQLFKFRTLVEKIKEDMNKDHTALNRIKRSMMSAVTENEIELNSTILKEICATHEQTLVKREQELLDAKQNVENTENRLKCLYGMMVESFENTFNTLEKGNPLKSAATGVFKRSSSDNNSLTELKKISLTLASSEVDLDFKEKGPLEDSPRTYKPPPLRTRTLSKKKKSKKTKQEVLLSPIIKASASGLTLFDFNNETGDKTRTSEDFRQEQQTQIMSECPMTGDPSTDREILNFIRKRKAVFRKINSQNLIARSLQDFPTTSLESTQRTQSVSKSEPPL